MLLGDLDGFLREYLEIERFVPIDASLNGLQVGRRDKEVRRVAYTVDAALETMRRAAEAEADMLLVHHGIFWGQVYPIVGPAFERFRTLLDHDLALYAVHLPLDYHPEVGNNAAMAERLGLVDTAPFGLYRGTHVGWKGRLPAPMTPREVAEALFGTSEEILSLLPFGREKVESVGIVSGGAPKNVSEAIAEGLDLFVTGDASHTIYHEALEGGINVIFGGHYATETWGVRRLAELLSEKFGVEAFEIDLPTGL
jgi:dinuclear metal center YbgI/SA1388 family protein